MSSTRPGSSPPYERLADVGRALSSPQRLKLLDLLCQADRSVEQLARLSGLSVANTSQHLQSLKRARLVVGVRVGRHVVHALASAEVADFVAAYRRLARSQLTEIDAWVRELHRGAGAFEPIDAATLLRRARAGEVTVVDVRPAEEFRAGHLPGAISIPLEELESRLAEIPVGREVIAYCRGPFCCLAVEATRLLCAAGHRARPFDEGVTEWAARGYALEPAA
jgi:rhodanese-related sulfurtransferase